MLVSCYYSSKLQSVKAAVLQISHKCLKLSFSENLSPVERDEAPPKVTLSYVIMVLYGYDATRSPGASHRSCASGMLLVKHGGIVLHVQQGMVGMVASRDRRYSRVNIVFLA